MNRRDLLQALLLSSSVLALPACRHLTRPQSGKQVMTVNGPIDASEMGVTLTHEHVFADLRSYEEQVSQRLPIDVDEVVAVALPYLAQVRELGCRTLIDCTATHLGRHPMLLKRLATLSGVNMLTATGAYLAADERFVPDYVRSDTSDQLARRWIQEWRNGIEDTGIRPGLIKLGMNGGPLTALEEKVFRAAVKTHQETGLTIATHVGPWREVEPGFNGKSVSQQLAILKASGVSASAWIWYHAQNEKDPTQHVRAAEHGAWVSFDGVAPNTLEAHVHLVKRMKDRGVLNQVLVCTMPAGTPRASRAAGLFARSTRRSPSSSRRYAQKVSRRQRSSSCSCRILRRRSQSVSA